MRLKLFIFLLIPMFSQARPNRLDLEYEVSKTFRKTVFKIIPKIDSNNLLKLETSLEAPISERSKFKFTYKKDSSDSFVVKMTTAF